MAFTTTAELGDTIPTIIEKAHLTSQFNAVMAGLVWNIRKGQGQGSTVNVPYFGEVTASQLTEGIDMTSSETMEDTNVQITLNEVGAKIILTDNALEDDQEMVSSIAGKILGQANEKKRDTDLLALLDNGTNSMGGASTTLTMGHIAAAKAILGGNATTSAGPAPLPYVCVLHPFQTLDLVDVITPIVPYTAITAGAASGISGYGATGTAFTDEILRNYTIGRLFGMNIVEDGNVPVISGSTDCKTGVFSMGEGGAIILATARDWDVRPERDESLRGFEINCVGRYGVGNYLNGWTVELHTDRSTPA